MAGRKRPLSDLGLDLVELADGFQHQTQAMAA